jgi:hypothetical protein
MYKVIFLDRIHASEVREAEHSHFETERVVELRIGPFRRKFLARYFLKPP